MYVTLAVWFMHIFLKIINHLYCRKVFFVYLEINYSIVKYTNLHLGLFVWIVWFVLEVWKLTWTPTMIKQPIPHTLKTKVIGRLGGEPKFSIEPTVVDNIS